MTLPAISKHIKVLEQAGLVVRGRHAQYRPCALDAAPLADVSTWAEQYRPVWEARFDRMHDYLGKLQRRQEGDADDGERRFHEAVVIERVLDAPINLVWQMWTDPEHFKHWYGPAGATIPVAKMDLRVAGTRTVCMEMQTPNGLMQMWFTGEYREVVEHRRLVYTESMCDEHGAISSPPGHPDTTEVTVELEDVGGRTKMVLTHAASPRLPGATGWVMALDKLAAYIKTPATNATPSHSAPEMTPRRPADNDRERDTVIRASDASGDRWRDSARAAFTGYCRLTKGSIPLHDSTSSRPLGP